jgi:hypothetical protein
MELSEELADVAWYESVWESIKDGTIRVVLHIGMNLVFPGIGSALVEAYFAIKEIIDIIRELYHIYELSEEYY